MGVAKTLVLEIANSTWYTGLQRAVAEGDQNEAERYHGLISRAINGECLAVGSRMSGYDMASIAEHGLRPVEKVRVYLMSPKERRRIEQVGGFIDALHKQAEKYLPVWYRMGNLPI